jgi:hypothetical protein
VKIGDLYWFIKLGKGWENHPTFLAHMCEQMRILQKVLEVGTSVGPMVLEDVQAIDDMPIPSMDDLK